MIFTLMKIVLITPAMPKSRAGNRVTAVRWKTILLELGHEVDVKTQLENTPKSNAKYDLMLALHSWRSAKSIHLFKQQFPEKPLVVALTGTDLYRFIKSHPKPTLRSIELADKLITLHNIADLAIPKKYRHKVHVIYQSADFLQRKVSKNKKYFDVCVIGHLREEKDPLRAAYAVRKLPDDSRIRVKQYGKAHTEIWAKRAEKEMQINSRYKWYGEVPHWKINQLYTNADLMVLSSKMEGGANVISEACAVGLPVIASKIDGTIGLLGKTYPGYYPYANTTALKNVLLRTESDAKFLKKLARCCKAKANLFTYQREKYSMKNLLNDLL